MQCSALIVPAHHIMLTIVSYLYLSGQSVIRGTRHGKLEGVPAALNLDTR